MSLKQPIETLSAEARYRQALERLKAGSPTVLPQGTPVTQNNVAREANCDPSALKKARFPALIREIQAYAQSVLLSANRRILELSSEVQSLTLRLDELQPPPTKLGGR